MKTVKEATQTKGGKPVRIYATDGGGTYPVHGATWIGETGEWIIQSWDTDGIHLDVDLSLDLHDWKEDIPWECLQEDIKKVKWDPNSKEWYGEIIYPDTVKYISLTAIKMPCPPDHKFVCIARRP